MTKHFYTILLVCLTQHVFAQDTLSGYVRYDKSSIHTIAHKGDTFDIYRAPGGQLEAKISRIANSKYKIYTRYYENGKTMWQKEMKGLYANGYSIYFSQKGKKLAEFTFKNDTIVDTIFFAKRERLLFGRMTYESTVHGGMVREDGTSNISHSSGPRAHVDMYVVKLDSAKSHQTIYSRFRTDHRGEFFIHLEEGKFGFFDSRFDTRKITHTMGTSSSTVGKSMQGGWNREDPLFIDKKCYNTIHLHYTSVGYAP